MSKADQTQKNPAAQAFQKPAHWSNEPPARAKAVDPKESEPRELSPTRYGDWERDGIAVDF